MYPHLQKTAPHHMNRTELTPEPITVSSHPSIPSFPPPLPSSFPFLAGLVLPANSRQFLQICRLQQLREKRHWHGGAEDEKMYCMSLLGVGFNFSNFHPYLGK